MLTILMFILRPQIDADEKIRTGKPHSIRLWLMVARFLFGCDVLIVVGIYHLLH